MRARKSPRASSIALTRLPTRLVIRNTPARIFSARSAISAGFARSFVTIRRCAWPSIAISGAELVGHRVDEVALLRRKRALQIEGTGEDLRLVREPLARLEKFNRVAPKHSKCARHLTDLVSPALKSDREICVIQRQPPHEARQFEQRP